MVTKVQLMIAKLLFLAIAVPAPVIGQTGQITVTPDNRVTPSTQVSLQCSIDRQQYPGAYVIWRKKIGSITLWLGTNNGLDQTFSTRYSLNADVDGFVDMYTLVIKDAQYEDSGTYTCTRGYNKGEGADSSVSLSVCDDTDSPSCRCMETEGWGSPSCFEQPEEAQVIIDRHKGAIIGVVVCLVIAIIYGVVVSIMLSHDCLNRMKLKAKKKLDALQNNRMNSTEHRQLNDSSEIQYHGSKQVGPPQGMYYIPQQPSHVTELDASSSHQYQHYDKVPQTQTVNIEHHTTPPDHHSHHHKVTDRQGHENQAYHTDEEKSYTQLKPPPDQIAHTSGATGSHSPGMSDSSTDSWGQSPRPKTSHYNYPQAGSTPETRQNQPDSHSPRQTGRQNLPQSGANSSRVAGTPTDREPGHRSYQTGEQKPSGKKRQAPQPGQESRSHDTRAPYSGQESKTPYHGQENKAPYHGHENRAQSNRAPYPGKESKAPYHGQENKTPHTVQDKNRAVPHSSQGVPGKYDTYESGLSTISQQTHAHHYTPQSTHSEHLASSPAQPGVEISQRGAFTDVTHNREHKGENREDFNARGHYAQPRKLEYVNGTVPSKGAYVSGTDTMI